MTTSKFNMSNDLIKVNLRRKANFPHLLVGVGGGFRQVRSLVELGNKITELL